MTAIQPALDGQVPEPPQPARTPRRRMDDFEAWLDEVLPTYEEVARTGIPFTTSEVQEQYDLPDPPDPASQWGKLPQRLKMLGLIEEYATDSSKRPTVHGSLVKRWIGVPENRRRAA